MDSNIENNRKTIRKPRVYIIWLAIFLCVFPLFYMTLYRYVDMLVCDYHVGQRLGLSESTPTLVMYIYNVIKTGMTREEVHIQLAKISNYAIVKKLPYRSEMLVAVEDVQLKTCSHPFNNVRLIIRYDEEDKLLSVDIPEDNINFVQTFLPSP